MHHNDTLSHTYIRTNSPQYTHTLSHTLCMSHSLALPLIYTNIFICIFWIYLVNQNIWVLI